MFLGALRTGGGISFVDNCLDLSMLSQPLYELEQFELLQHQRQGGSFNSNNIGRQLNVSLAHRYRQRQYLSFKSVQQREIGHGSHLLCVSLLNFFETVG